jgi:hypothetical protein
MISPISTKLFVHGKLGNFFLTFSADTMILISASRRVADIDFWLTVKFRFTGTLPAKRTAKFPIIPPIPGGKASPTLRSVYFLKVWDNRRLRSSKLRPFIRMGMDRLKSWITQEKALLRSVEKIAVDRLEYLFIQIVKAKIAHLFAIAKPQRKK